MAKTYWFTFGTESTANTGLTPVFTYFISPGVTLSAPGITESVSGTGAYSFEYGPTAPICFQIDGGAALSSSTRYIQGALDPIQAVDEKIGTTSDSFGSTSVDPASLMGYVKRLQENLEGNENFNKSTGILDIYSRGSSTLLIEKTITNSSSSATKT